MQFNLFKNRFRRRMRKRQHQVENLGVQAESMAERYFFKRLDNLGGAKRFVSTWLLFFVLLIGCLAGQIRALGGYYQTIQPIPGGIYSEGILGDFTNANPLYGVGEVDESVARLVFASLFTYDDRNALVGDLAESWSVDASGKIYTVQLKPNLVWHDGEPLTAGDVVFTYETLQNPDAQSPLGPSWQGIRVQARGMHTVTFTLPNLLASFPHNMTNGIIPKHKLKDVEPAALRSTNFNTLQPVGAGPFVWRGIQVSGATPETREAQISLVPFKQYHAGAPKLNNFVIHAFHDEKNLLGSFQRRELTAASLHNVPEEVKSNDKIVEHSFMLTAANMVFFRQSNLIFSDKAVRKALVQAADVEGITSKLGYPTRPVRGPLLQGQLGYDASLTQPGYDPAAAAASLDGAGWTVGDNGFRSKGGQPLRFSLTALDSREIRMVTDRLVADWRKVGVRVDVDLQNASNLNRIISSTDRNYEALLYGISIGTDPDVFVYWHSSQADPRSATRLNLAEYKSKEADTALEAGRTRADTAIRIVKYRPFLAAWQKDLPALGLYQPRYVYLTYGEVYGLEQHALNTDTDRYSNVHNWMVRRSSVTNQ